jgi:hypothetical protein
MNAAGAGIGRTLQTRRMNAARHIEPLDDDDAHAHARRLQCRGESARTRANDNDVGIIGNWNATRGYFDRAA